MTVEVSVSADLLGNGDLEALRRILQPSMVMVYEIGQVLGLRYESALALAQTIAIAAGSRLDLLTYHSRGDDFHSNYVLRTPLADGFPGLGWMCVACERAVDANDDVSYDIALVVRDEIRVVPL